MDKYWYTRKYTLSTTHLPAPQQQGLSRRYADGGSRY